MVLSSVSEDHRNLVRAVAKHCPMQPPPSQPARFSTGAIPWARILAGLLAICACTNQCSGQEWARKMFPVRSHDFGSVARGAKVEYRFEFSNIYKEDVHVSGVRSSCGCTSARVDEESLKTYGRSAIIATFNTRAFNGQKRATVTVTLDKPFPAEVQLQVAGYIRSDVVLHPGAVDFGTIDLGDAAERKITISYAGRSDWKILEAKPGSDFLEALLEETRRENGQVGYELTVRLREDAPSGYLKQQLMLVTNDRRSTQLPVNVEARVVPPVTITPASLFMGALKPGQKVTKQIVVQSKKPFRITGVECDQERFEFATPQAAKTVHLIPVTFIAGDTPGELTYKIRIETDLGESTSLELSARAQVLAASSEAEPDTGSAQ